LSFDTFALSDLPKDEFRNILTGSSFAHRAENYRNEKWSMAHEFGVRRLGAAFQVRDLD
jgi:hypothetical protein